MPHPLACVAGAIAPEEREPHRALASRLFGLAGPCTPLEHGYALTLPAEEFDAVSRFVANERRCCPFLRFEIVLAEDELQLSMTGPAGTRELLEAELGIEPKEAP